MFCKGKEGELVECEEEGCGMAGHFYCIKNFNEEVNKEDGDAWEVPLRISEKLPSLLFSNAVGKYLDIEQGEVPMNTVDIIPNKGSENVGKCRRSTRKTMNMNMGMGVGMGMDMGATLNAPPNPIRGGQKVVRCLRHRSKSMYCMCREEYENTEFMIGCDRCENWYHGKCVNLSPEAAGEISSYICPPCRTWQDMLLYLDRETNGEYSYPEIGEGKGTWRHPLFPNSIWNLDQRKIQRLSVVWQKRSSQLLQEKCDMHLIYFQIQQGLQFPFALRSIQHLRDKLEEGVQLIAHITHFLHSFHLRSVLKEDLQMDKDREEENCMLRGEITEYIQRMDTIGVRDAVVEDKLSREWEKINQIERYWMEIAGGVTVKRGRALEELLLGALGESSEDINILVKELEVGEEWESRAKEIVCGKRKKRRRNETLEEVEEEKEEQEVRADREEAEKVRREGESLHLDVSYLLSQLEKEIRSLDNWEKDYKQSTSIPSAPNFWALFNNGSHLLLRSPYMLSLLNHLHAHLSWGKSANQFREAISTEGENAPTLDHLNNLINNSINLKLKPQAELESLMTMKQSIFEWQQSYQFMLEEESNQGKLRKYIEEGRNFGIHLEEIANIKAKLTMITKITNIGKKLIDLKELVEIEGRVKGLGEHGDIGINKELLSKLEEKLIQGRDLEQKIALIITHSETEYFDITEYNNIIEQINLSKLKFMEKDILNNIIKCVKWYKNNLSIIKDENNRCNKSITGSSTHASIEDLVSLPYPFLSSLLAEGGSWAKRELMGRGKELRRNISIAHCILQTEEILNGRVSVEEIERQEKRLSSLDIKCEEGGWDIYERIKGIATCIGDIRREMGELKEGDIGERLYSQIDQLESQIESINGRIDENKLDMGEVTSILNNYIHWIDLHKLVGRILENRPINDTEEIYRLHTQCSESYIPDTPLISQLTSLIHKYESWIIKFSGYISEKSESFRFLLTDLRAIASEGTQLGINTQNKLDILHKDIAHWELWRTDALQFLHSHTQSQIIDSTLIDQYLAQISAMGVYEKDILIAFRVAKWNSKATQLLSHSNPTKVYIYIYIYYLDRHYSMDPFPCRNSLLTRGNSYTRRK